MFGQYRGLLQKLLGKALAVDHLSTDYPLNPRVSNDYQWQLLECLTRCFRFSDEGKKPMRRFLLATLLSFLPLAANAVDDPFRDYRPGLNTDVWSLGYNSFAPWVKDYKSAAKDGTMLVAGSSKIIFREGRIDAPDPIGCATAKYELKAVTAAKLFGGKLAKPDDDAKDLGFDKNIVMLETGCPTKFYFVDPYKACFYGRRYDLCHRARTAVRRRAARRQGSHGSMPQTRRGQSKSTRSLYRALP
jgi:hypothetical protein